MNQDQDKSQLFVQKNDPKGGKLSEEKLPLPKVELQNTAEVDVVIKKNLFLLKPVGSYYKLTYDSLES